MSLRSSQILLLLVIVFLPASVIFGQSSFRDGYIVTMSNDSISGLLDYGDGNKLHERVKFKRHKDSSIEEYNPNELDRFRFLGDKLYKSLRVEEGSELIFVEVLVEGRLTLSKYGKSFFLEKVEDETIYDISEKVKENSETGRAQQNRSTRHLGILKILLSDSKKPISLEGFRSTERNLTELIDNYNSTFGKSLDYKEEKPWAKLQIGVTVGISNSKMQNLEYTMGSNYSKFSDFSYDLQPLFGLNLLFTRPRISEKVGMYGEVLFTQSEHSAFNFTYLPYQGKQYINLSVSSLKIPVAFRYMVSNQKFGSFINIGLVYYNHFSSESTAFAELNIDNNLKTFERDELPLKKSEVGGWASIGVNKSLTQMFTGFAEFRYELSNGFVGNIQSIPGTLQKEHGARLRNHFSVVVGIQLK